MTILREAPTTTDRDWRLSPNFLLRVGGLPFELADQLRSQSLRDSAAELSCSLATFEAAGNRSADALFEAIGGEERTEVRRSLMKLRRDMHNGRPTKSNTSLPRAVADVVGDYEKARQRYEAARRAFDEVVDSEIDRSREILAAVASVPDLRLGMQLSSVEIDRHVDAYLADARRPLNKKTRGLETSLVEYLHRTACKTSPFGRLTTVTAGSIDDQCAAPLSLNQEPSSAKRSLSRISLVVISRLAAAVLSSPELMAQVEVALVPGAAHAGAETLTYWRRRVKRGDGDVAVVLDNVSEARFIIPAGEAVAAVVDALGSGTLPLGELAERICDARRAWSRSEMVECLQVLIELGVLYAPKLTIDTHAQDPLMAFRGSVGALVGKDADLLNVGLQKLQSAVDAFSEAPIDERRAILRDVRRDTTTLFSDLGASHLECPQTVIFEDSTIGSAEASASCEWWDSVGQDLAAVARLLPAFDLNGVRRAAMTGYFERRIGSGGRHDDLLEFIHDFDQDFYGNLEQRLMRHRRFDDEQFMTVDNWFRQESISKIDAAREAFRDRLAAVANGGDDVDLAELLGEDFLADVPESGVPYAGWSFFLQIADADGDSCAVVNRIHAGVGMTHSRFLNLLPNLADDLRGEFGDSAGENAVLAELVGGVDTTNLNVHPPILPFEIVCPGQRSSRPAGQQLTISDLYVEHLPGEDRLRLVSSRLGQEVIPVYQGLLVPMALPDTQRILLNFSCPGPVIFDPWNGVRIPESEVSQRPRIWWGNVLLERRQWNVPADLFPSHRGSAQVPALVREWQEFADRYDLPDRVFVLVPGESKPSYVDRYSVRSIETVALLGRGATAPFTVVEMKPGPDELWLRDEKGERYVTELTIDINGARNARV